MIFLRRVASVNETYMNNILDHDVDMDYLQIGKNIL